MENEKKFIEDLYKIYSHLIKTPPLTYYYGTNLPLVLDYKENDNVGTAYIDLENKNIHLSFQGLLTQLVSFAQVKNVDDLSKIGEDDLSKMVRANLYHELSHAILTPKNLVEEFIKEQQNRNNNSFNNLSVDEKHSIINIIEDERIETYMQDYYLSTNFEANKRLQPVYLEIDKYNLQCVNDFQSFFYRAVRFRKDKGIPKYDLVELSKFCNKEDQVRRALMKLQEIIDINYKEFFSMNCFSNSFKDTKYDKNYFLFIMGQIYNNCRKTFDDFIKPNLKQENKQQQQNQNQSSSNGSGSSNKQQDNNSKQQDTNNSNDKNNSNEEKDSVDNKQGSDKDKDNSSNEGNSNKEDEEKKKQLEQVEKNIEKASEDKSNSFLDENKDKLDTLDNLDNLDNPNRKGKSENRRKVFIEELAKRKVFGDNLVEKINYFEKIFETAFISSKNNKDGYSYVRKNNIGAGKIKPKLVAKPLISTQGKNFIRTSYVPNNIAIGGKKNLNIFIDASGSYSNNVKATAQVLEKLDKALKKHKNLFNVKLSLIGSYPYDYGTLKSFKLRPAQNNSNQGGLYVFEEGIQGYLNAFKKNARILSGGGSDLYYNSLKEFKLNDRNSYNIVLIDGTSFFNDKDWDKEFNNSYLIVDSGYCSKLRNNLRNLKIYQPKFEQQVNSNDYPQKLEIVLVNVIKDICLSQNSVLTNLRSNKELELVR